MNGTETPRTPETVKDVTRTITAKTPETVAGAIPTGTAGTRAPVGGRGARIPHCDTPATSVNDGTATLDTLPVPATTAGTVRVTSMPRSNGNRIAGNGTGHAVGTSRSFRTTLPAVRNAARPTGPRLRTAPPARGEQVPERVTAQPQQPAQPGHDPSLHHRLVRRVRQERTRRPQRREVHGEQRPHVPHPRQHPAQEERSALPVSQPQEQLVGATSFALSDQIGWSAGSARPTTTASTRAAAPPRRARARLLPITTSTGQPGGHPLPSR